ncbi:MAG: S9 family peptidase, partial [Spirochaetia bacterium]
MQIRSYGLWESPVTEELVVRGSLRPRNIVTDGTEVYWSEARPEEGGRTVICRSAGDGGFEEVIPEPYNARTRVHEYGGGAFTVHEGIIYFVNFADQRIYRAEQGRISPLTPSGTRFADLHVTEHGLVCVGEEDGPETVENFLCLVNLEDGGIARIAEGHDFYASPDIRGNRITWLTWDHSDMPWNATELWAGELGPAGITDIVKITGGGSESVFQPRWGPEGILYFVSDREEWWNFYAWDGKSVYRILTMEAEFAVPQWAF